MANKLIVAPAPHFHSGESTTRIMWNVIAALLPALAISVKVFGIDVLFVTALAITSCVVFEYLIQKFLVKGPITINNLSAVLTGLLLAFNLPSTIPWWIVIMGSFVAIAIAKMTFGGLGKNPFNPALVGRVFLLIAYPVQMTSFAVVENGSMDALSGATPLAAVKSGVGVESLDMVSLFVGAVPGSFGEVAALGLLLGFIYLLIRRVITWHIPVAILGTMALFALVVATFNCEIETNSSISLIFDAITSSFNFALFHIMAGGAILGAVYMATDYTTSPMSTRGMLLFGVGIGVITMCIRLWGAYPEGMSFAILIMNAAVPLINKYIKPKRFGKKLSIKK